MKCKLCKRKTTWDESYGKENFIVCPICHDRLANVIRIMTDNHPYSNLATSGVIIEMGLIREEKK